MYHFGSTGESRRAVIGISAVFEVAQWSFWSQPAALVAGTYLESVQSVGGLPLLIVPEDLQDPIELDVVLTRIDGLLLIGGTDLDPDCYGATHSARTERTVALRDRFEVALADRALRADVPLLGICRGLQVMNVATGGTLHQHLTDAGFGEHRPAPGRLDEATAHDVEVKPGTLASAALRSQRQTVNSHHHQGVALVGDGGRVTARSIPDRAIEAIEWPAQRYALGVQWHPETLDSRPLFASFVAAATPTTGLGQPEQTANQGTPHDTDRRPGSSAIKRPAVHEPPAGAHPIR